jgi:hypothetical protein
MLFLLIVGGAISVGISGPIKNERLIHTDAQFISQKHVTVFFGSLQVKVRFTAIKPQQNIITYVYPSDQHLFEKQPLIPVTYLASHPSNAYYAGPGGDAKSSDFVGVPFVKTLGVAAVLIGLILILQQLNWRRRMLRLLSSASDQGPLIRLHWCKDNWYSSTIVASVPTTPWQLSWRALTIDSQIDLSSIRRLKRTWPRRNRIKPDTTQAGGNLKIGQRAVIRSSYLIFLPLSSVCPVTLNHEAVEITNQDDDLIVFHRQLLSAYADVLNLIHQLPATFGAAGRKYSVLRRSRFRTLLCWRFMVRFHAEAHIRRQLRCLAKVYVRRQFSHAIPTGSDNKKLSHLHEECNEFVESFSDRSRFIAAILVSLTIVAPVVPIILKANPVPLYTLLKTLFSFIVAAILYSPVVIAVVVYADAFRFKRQLFGADLPSISFRAHKNVYELEDRLYSALDQPKWREGAPDLWLRATVIAILCIAIGRLIFNSGYASLSIFEWILSAVVIVFPVWSLAKGIFYRMRAER